MTENITNDEADVPFEWASFKTFDEQGRLIQLSRFPVAKESVCGECHGSGRVILLTSSKSCPLCLGSGRRIVTGDVWTVTHYERSPADGTEEASPGARDNDGA